MDVTPSQPPEQQRYARVLDWGIGHGQGLITWQQMHPDSECHGVDLSAPCLKLAHRRAVEHGYRFHLSQQDLEHLLAHLVGEHLEVRPELDETRRAREAGEAQIGRAHV